MEINEWQVSKRHITCEKSLKNNYTIIYLPGNLETLEELPEVLHQALLDGVESEKIQTKFEKQVTEASTLSLNRMFKESVLILV